MDQQSGPQDSRVISYLALRKAVGIIGFSLPFVLAIGRMLQQGFGIEGSISCYYYTGRRNVFVGSLCAIGVFLLSTRGYDWRDEISGRLACVLAMEWHSFQRTPAPAECRLMNSSAHCTRCWPRYFPDTGIFLPGAVYEN